MSTNPTIDMSPMCQALRAAREDVRRALPGLGEKFGALSRELERAASEAVPAVQAASAQLAAAFPAPDVHTPQGDRDAHQ